jgi:Outer membrane lipoprotein-sorting protein
VRYKAEFPLELIMHFRPWHFLRVLSTTLGLTSLALYADAADVDPAVLSAKDLATSLSALQDGASYVRLRLEVKQPTDTTKISLQVQIKQRRSRTTADVVYQVLWPKEHKGEAVLLRKAEGTPPSGLLYIPPDKPRALDPSQMSEPLFGSDLSYQDVIENFFGWENQKIVGSEMIDRVSCVILESRPEKGVPSLYAAVRSWIDSRRLVPLRVEKYLASGQLARRIDTTRVATDDKGRSIPADLTVRGSREDSLTNLDGSRIRHDVAYTDRDFAPEGLTEVLPPPSAPE